MQTDFTPAQLDDPTLARANAILRACVHCGFCTALLHKSCEGFIS